MNSEIQKTVYELAERIATLVEMSRGHLEIHYFGGKPRQIDEIRSQIKFDKIILDNHPSFGDHREH